MLHERSAQWPSSLSNCCARSIIVDATSSPYVLSKCGAQRTRQPTEPAPEVEHSAAPGGATVTLHVGQGRRDLVDACGKEPIDVPTSVASFGFGGEWPRRDRFGPSPPTLPGAGREPPPGNLASSRCTYVARHQTLQATNRGGLSRRSKATKTQPGFRSGDYPSNLMAKKRQTFGKMIRERERAEKRARKQEKKDQRKAMIEAGLDPFAEDPYGDRSPDAVPSDAVPSDAVPSDAAPPDAAPPENEPETGVAPPGEQRT